MADGCATICPAVRTSSGNSAGGNLRKYMPKRSPPSPSGRAKPSSCPQPSEVTASRQCSASWQPGWRTVWQHSESGLRQGGISILTRYTDLKMSEPTSDADDSEFSDRASPRAIRRHHKRRMKAKAILIARRVLGIVSLGLWSDENAKAAAKNADHLASCSCAMCCNPRRSKFYSGKSQTRKEMQAERDLGDSVE